jgi:hypothetical protein
MIPNNMPYERFLRTKARRFAICTLGIVAPALLILLSVAPPCSWASDPMEIINARTLQGTWEGVHLPTEQVFCLNCDVDRSCQLSVSSTSDEDVMIFRLSQPVFSNEGFSAYAGDSDGRRIKIIARGRASAKKGELELRIHPGRRLSFGFREPLVFVKTNGRVLEGLAIAGRRAADALKSRRSLP